MKWRLLNPASIAFITILLIVYLIMSLLLIATYENHGFSSEAVRQAYSFPITVLFDPSSLKGIRGDPFFTKLVIAILGFWVLCWFFSGQPYVKWLRMLGSILGVVTVLIWTLYSLLVGILSGVS